MKHLKGSSQFIKDTMSAARLVQRRYAMMKAPSTQSPRNPLPMYRLIASVLPTLPDPESIIPIKTRSTVSILGRKMTQTRTETAYASEALGQKFYEKNALSLDDIISKIKSKGFIVNSRMTVTLNLCLGKGCGAVASVRSTHKTGKRGAPKSLYFIPQS